MSIDKSTWGKPRPKEITMKKPPVYKQKRRTPSGESTLFKQIFKERVNRKDGKLYSQVSGQEIRFSSEWNFHHVLPKGLYPHFKMEKRNIIVITALEHDLWHTKKEKLRNDPKWQWVFDLEEKLKQEYRAKESMLA